MYRAKGGIGPSQKTFKKVDFCYDTRWYRFWDECGLRPIGTDGEPLHEDDLDPLWPRVPLEHLICGKGDHLFTRVDLNGIGVAPVSYTACYYVAFYLSPEPKNCYCKGGNQGRSNDGGQESPVDSTFI